MALLVNRAVHFLAVQAARLEYLAAYIENPRLHLLRRRGVGLETYRKLTHPWLQGFGFRTVLDIGANTGQFALSARFAFPQARLYSFEPLPDCFAKLNQNLAGASNFQAFNVGLGATSGSLAFEQNQFSAASSFLKLTPTYSSEFPAKTQTSSIAVKVEPLDVIAKQLSLTPPLLVKIDVQGFEDQVLRGGTQTLRQADVLLIETSFEALYENQPLFDDVYRHLVSEGFVYQGALEQLLSPKDQRPLQADSLFVRGGK